MTRTFTTPLQALDRRHLPLAGGKGANLGELVRLGLPVPDGFVVTTDAYAAVIEHAGLRNVITEFVEAGSTEGAALRTTLETAAIPEAIRRSVTEAYARLGGGPVAVRSSATTEDLPGAAFAGQHDTHLNVIGADAVLDAVRRC